MTRPTNSQPWDGLLLDCRLATMADAGASLGVIEQAALGWKDGVICYAGPQRALSESTRQSARHVESVDGRWITPPLSCGLLPGVGRALAIESGRIREEVLHVRDISKVRSWAFLNSLRGWLDAEIGNR